MGDLSVYPGAGPAAAKTMRALERVNEKISGHGLTLSGREMLQLARRREALLQDNGRVEFGEGILPKLVFAFCDSPHIAPGEFAGVIEELLECFYYFKNETREQVGDETLLNQMKTCFEGSCHGSTELLAGTLLEQYARGFRLPGDAIEGEGAADEEEDEDEQ